MTATPTEAELKDRVAGVLSRWPAGGLAVGVVREGRLAWFHGHGVADTITGAPIDEDTVFRVASISKTFTAVAVMQLWEHGRIDLDAPANDYLRAYKLVPARATFRPASVRHLLTHTAGIGELRHPADVLRPTLGLAVRNDRPRPPLARYYRGGLRIEVEPGAKWAYANHGFATLGQIVEDVSGEPFDAYLRHHVFAPLGMESTDSFRSTRTGSRLATGYTLRARGLRPVADREAAVPGAGGVYSSTRDMARYVMALLNGGTNDHGSVLRPETVATMFAPHYQPDARIPGMGLAFLRGEEGRHRTVGHDGGWPGFISQMVLAPDDGVGVVAFTNTGSRAPLSLGASLLRDLVGLPDKPIGADLPEHPETWAGLCGLYTPQPGPLTNLRTRAAVGAGVRVTVRHRHLVLRGLTPVPLLRRGFRLLPDPAGDPDVFHLHLSPLGLGSGTAVFSRDDVGRATALHVALSAPVGLVSLPRRRRRPGRA